MRAWSSVSTSLGVDDLIRPVDPVIEPPIVHRLDLGGPEMQNGG